MELSFIDLLALIVVVMLGVSGSKLPWVSYGRSSLKFICSTAVAVATWVAGVVTGAFAKASDWLNGDDDEEGDSENDS